MDIYSTLPIIKPEVFRYLSGKDIIRLCQTDRTFAVLCRDDKLWYNLVVEDYFFNIPLKPENITWRQYYNVLLNSPPAIIYYNDVIEEAPADFLTSDYLIDRFNNWQWQLCCVMRGKEVISIFTPEGYGIDFGHKDVTDVIFIPSFLPRRRGPLEHNLVFPINALVENNITINDQEGIDAWIQASRDYNLTIDDIENIVKSFQQAGLFNISSFE